MKKFFVYLLILVMILSLSGCMVLKGNELQVSFNPESRTLTLSGKGKVVGLYDEDSGKNQPVEKKEIRTVVIEEGITELQSCFNDMVAMENIDFPNSLENIYDSFKGESLLENLFLINTNIKRISDDSFAESPLSSIDFPESVYLGNGAFDRLTELYNVSIPKGSVCEGVFRDCAKLEEVVIAENVRLKESENGANFSQSSSNDFPKAYLCLPTDGEDLPWGEGGKFRPIIVPNAYEWRHYRNQTMYHKGEPLNEYTTNFDAATGTLIINGKGDIEALYPWDNLSNGEKDEHEITKLVLSEGITGVYNSFNHLVALKEIEIPTTLDVIDQSFNDAFSLGKLVVPKTVKKIVNRSFCYAYSLKDIQFEGAIELGNPSAFNYYLPIESIVFPEGSKIVGVFVDSPYLKEVVIGPNVYYGVASLGPDSGDHIANFDNYTTLHGPKIYMCEPIAERPSKGSDEIHCGEYGGYCPIIVPEGEDWKDYKDMPLPRRGNYEELKKRSEEYIDDGDFRYYEAKKKAAMERVST